MRTTLTLDPDVAIRLEKLRKERELPFKILVNDALRRGLDTLERPVERRETYRSEPWDLGPCRLPNLDDVTSALIYAEGDAHR